jgi:hypothetical protein
VADFAEKHGNRYQRIDSLAKNSGGQVVLLDMKDESTRRAVREASSALALYDGEQSRTYL